MKIGIVQFQSTAILEDNLARMQVLFTQSKQAGAELVIFPEMAYLTGASAVWKPKIQEFDRLLSVFSEWARQHQVALIPGSLREPSGPNRFFNTLPVFSATGQCLARYRKAHLFKAALPHKNYDEAEHCDAGEQALVVEVGGWKLGLSICFDLRFPEFYAALRKQGAQVLLIPSAFTVPTGKAHWEVLCRARAIENQAYVIAPGLTGKNGDGLETYGHSLVVSPWGEVLTDLGEGTGVNVVELSKQAIEKAKSQVIYPSLRKFS